MAGFGRPTTCRSCRRQEGQVIVAVDIDTTGSDRGLARPALERLSAARTTPSGLPGRWRLRQERRHRVGACERHRIVVPAGAQQARHRSLRAAADDKPGVADWRQRMASEPGKALYKQRAQAECPNAWARRMGLAGCACAASRRPAPCCCGSRSPTTCCVRSYCSRPPRRPRRLKAALVICASLNRLHLIAQRPSAAHSRRRARATIWRRAALVQPFAPCAARMRSRKVEPAEKAQWFTASQDRKGQHCSNRRSRAGPVPALPSRTEAGRERSFWGGKPKFN